MNNRLFLVPCAAALPLALASQPALAQAVPDVQDAITEGSQIDAAISARAREQIAQGEDGEIDGEAGIYVLRVNEIFYVGGTAGLIYSENPTRTFDDIGDSFGLDFAAVAGVQTKVDERFDLGASLTISGIDYFKNFAPSSRNVIASATVGTPIGTSPLYLSFSGFGGYNFDEDFQDGTSFYGAAGSLSAAVLLGPRTVLNPGIGITRQWSEIEENNSSSLGMSAAVTHQLTSRASVRAELGARRSWYDDFYEDVTFVKRRDWSYSGAVSGSYVLGDNVSLGLTLGYEERDSTFFLSEYDSFEGSVSLSLRHNF